MTIDSLADRAKDGVAAAGQSADEAIRGTSARARDAAHQVEGRANRAVDSAEEILKRIVQEAVDAATTIRNQASDAYGVLAHSTKVAAEKIEPTLKERPYAALAVTALTGLVIGLLFAGPSIKREPR